MFLLILIGLGLLLWLLRQNRLLVPLRRKAEQIDALAGVGQAILGAQLKLDALCEVVYQQASQIMDTRNFQLGLFDGDDYAIHIWLRDGERQPSERFPNAGTEGLIGWMRRTGQELLIGDYQQEWERLPAKPRYEASQPARSAVFAPLVASGTTIGVIAVQSHEPNAFTAADMRLLMVVTNQAAGAIRNAQLFEEAQARNRRMQLVSEVGRQVTSMQPLHDLFRQVVSLVQQTFGYYAVNIYVLDEKMNALRLGASSHSDIRDHVIRLTTGEGLLEWAAVNARTALAADVTQDSRYLADARFGSTRAEVAVPLVIERRVLGVLDVQSDQVGAFTHDDVTVLEALATQVALALQEGQTYEAERRQRERLNALTEASRAVVSILNIDDLLEEVVDLATDYFGFDRTHIFLRDGEHIVFRAGSGVHSGRWAIEHLAYDIEGPGLIARVARTGMPVICNDVTDYDDYVPGPGIEDTRAELVIPIHMGRQTLGVLDIQSTSADAFSSDDAELAEALSDTVAIALRNATLYAREKRRRILAESLREVSTGLGASLEVDSVLNGVLQGLERVIPVTSAMIVLFDEDAEAYRISAVHGQIDTEIQGTLLPLDTDISAEVTRYFHPADEADGPESDDHALDEHEHLLVPLLLGDDPIGYLAVDYHAGRFSLDDLEIINAFATQSAIAIANAQLYMAQREEAWISTALLQVAEATARATSLDEVLQTVARITPLLVGVEWCCVLLREASGFRVVEIEGVSPEISEVLVGATVELQDWPPLADLVQHGEPTLLVREPVPLPESIERRVSIDQGVMLPLFAKGDVMGALLIGQQDQAEILSIRKVELVGGIANQAALAIESAQLYAAQQEEAWITTALLQVAEAVNAQVELNSTLQTVVRLTPLLVGVERCGVLRWDGLNDQLSGGISYGFSPSGEVEFAQLNLAPAAHPYLAKLCSATTPVPAGPDVEEATPPRLATIFQTETLLGLPLIAQGRLAGIMIVDRPQGSYPIDRRQMNILTGIASQTALAIETSHLQAAVAERQQLERELEVAKEIQSSFLPDTAPSVPGWEVSAYYRAARMVGGDFYDFIELPDETWGLVVADVADKGIPAALYMALTRT
ncbi:MAG: GAF domain-containing protein, partial [Anaerolineae bacterium]|nr:GAF domain-containing protein [Anaerolineae bacterium]